jgi:hypothetical protein
MSMATKRAPNEMAILRRVVDRKYSELSEAAARAIVRLDLDETDRKRMNELAARNRAGKLSVIEERELDSFIQVGQILGILKSKARQALKAHQS